MSIAYAKPSLASLTAHQRAALKDKAARLSAYRLASHLLATSPSEISPRAKELLFSITLVALEGGDFGRHFEPMELGGKTKTTHSADLSALTEAGLVERVNRNFLSGRPSYLYRPALPALTIQEVFKHEFESLEEIQG